MTPKPFTVVEGLLGYHSEGMRGCYEQVAQPFDWNFTRRDLDQLMARLAEREPQLRLAA